jgi:hypothetical protein
MQLYIFHPLRSSDDTKVPAHLEQKQSHEDLQRRDEREVSVGVYVLISKQTFRPEREHPAVNGGPPSPCYRAYFGYTTSIGVPSGTSFTNDS